MHARLSVATGQDAPPLAAGVATANAWVCVPPPHVAEQADQAVYEPWQSTGQPWTLHAWVCGEAGHEAPPLAGCCVTVNACDCVPPPHETEHALNPDQVPWQSTGGQAWALHACDRGAVGQATPPWVGCEVTVNVCD